MRLIHIARKLGLSDYFFHIMKRQRKEKFDLIFSFNKTDNWESVSMYISYVEQLIIKMGKILYYFEDNIREYGKLARENKIINHPNFTEFYNKEDELIFAVRAEDKDFLCINYQTVVRWEKIIAAFDKRVAA